MTPAPLPPLPALPDVARQSPLDIDPDAEPVTLQQRVHRPHGEARVTMPELQADGLKVRKNVTVSGRILALLNGQIRVEDLDDDELARGQVRDQNGRFSGRPSAMVPKQFHDEMVRRLLSRGQEMYRENYLKALQVHMDIAEDVTAKPADRLKAAQEVIQRVAGKIPDRVELSATVKPWESVLQGVMQPGDHLEVTVSKDGEDILDAEEVTEEDHHATQGLMVGDEESDLVNDDYYAEAEPETDDDPDAF